MNPGGFDYGQWLLVEGYGATGYVRSGERLGDVSGGIARRWLRMRRAAAERLAAASPSADAAALLIALTIGERFAFTEAHWADLRRTGTSHLVAISGLHVGLVATLVLAAVRRLWLYLPPPFVHRDLEAAAAAAALAAVGYAALAGFAVPTQRSAVMVLVALGVVVGRRAIGWGNGLAAALLVVIAFDPFAVLSASFWLSVGAVALLLALASRRAQRKNALHDAISACGARARGAAAHDELRARADRGRVFRRGLADLARREPRRDPVLQLRARAAFAGRARRRFVRCAGRGDADGARRAPRRSRVGGHRVGRGAARRRLAATRGAVRRERARGRRRRARDARASAAG